MTESFNRNPSGRNQHAPIPSADDPVLSTALQRYHREGKCSNKSIAELLAVEYNIQASESSIKRRRRELGLYGSRVTTKTMPNKDKEQLVVGQMEKDPSKGHGVANVKARIAHEQGVHLSRDYVAEVMHLHDKDAFESRDPSAKKIFRVKKAPLGIHERWSADGHDKLYRIGFPIWAIVDDGTGKWLGAWVVPSNRMGDIIGYLYLCLIEKYAGVPLESTTDCGSETTQLYGLANSIRDIFHPDFKELPAHRYLRSVHNIAIERSWLRLKLEFGNNAVTEFERGKTDGLYDPEDPEQFELCQWLWAKLLRQELASFVELRNAVKMRRDNSKAGPSGMSRNDAFSIPSKWGGTNCLLPIADLDVIRELKKAMGGESLLNFVSPEFAAHAEQVYKQLSVSELTMQNAWYVFKALLPLVYNHA